MPTKRRFTPRAYRRIGQTEYAIPKAATYEVDDSTLPYIVTITLTNEGVPACEEVTVRRREGGPPVGSERLREIPLQRLTQEVAEALILKLADPSRGLAGGLEPVGSLDSAKAAAAASRSDRAEGRRRITDDDLEALAAVCRKADALGVSYIALAYRELGLTRDQASQRRRKAIRAGFYTPTERES